MPLTPGSTFERYEIQSLIGRGGMGEVYRAIDTRLHRPVALKVLRTDKEAAATVADAGGTARLLREARAAAALNHANSVAIYELGEAEGIAYIAMELVSGVTLRRYIGDRNVSVETKVSWLVDAARALWAAHKAGLVHRDVKPGNIMVSEEGVVKVLDFGLAKPIALPKKVQDFQTLGGQVLGTPRYMSPEQLEGSPANASADQYAFGLTGYELISGVYAGGPFATSVASLDTIVAHASPELARTIARMMARAPATRFPTMEDAAHALRACLSSQPRQHAISAAPPARTGAHPSDAPTVVHTVEPVSVSREVPVVIEEPLAKGGTLPLSVPFKAAIGDHAAKIEAAKNFNKTMPLSQPGVGSIPSAPPSAPSSGPVASQQPATPRPPTSAPSATMPGIISGVYASENAARAAAKPDSPGSRWWLLSLVVTLLAIAIGALAAWRLR